MYCQRVTHWSRWGSQEGRIQNKGPIIDFTMGIRPEQLIFTNSFYLLVQNGSAETARAWLAIPPPSSMRKYDKPHPSNLTALFRVMGEAGLSSYQHSVFQISLFLTKQERGVKLDMGDAAERFASPSMGETSAGYRLSYSSGVSVGENLQVVPSWSSSTFQNVGFICFIFLKRCAVQ